MPAKISDVQYVPVADREKKHYRSRTVVRVQKRDRDGFTPARYDRWPVHRDGVQISFVDPELPMH